MADTGNGASVAFSVTTGVGNATQITMNEITVEDVETSHLGTTNYKTFRAADLSDAGEIVVETQWAADASDVPSRGAEEVITVTWPIHTSGNTQAATFVADGYIKSVKLPDFANGELQLATITFKLNGEDTEPAYSVET